MDTLLNPVVWWYTGAGILLTFVLIRGIRNPADRLGCAPYFLLLAVVFVVPTAAILAGLSSDRTIAVVALVGVGGVLYIGRQWEEWTRRGQEHQQRIAERARERRRLYEADPEIQRQRAEAAVRNAERDRESGRRSKAKRRAEQAVYSLSPIGLERTRRDAFLLDEALSSALPAEVVDELVDLDDGEDMTLWDTVYLRLTGESWEYNCAEHEWGGFSFGEYVDHYNTVRHAVRCPECDQNLDRLTGTDGNSLEHHLEQMECMEL